MASFLHQFVPHPYKLHQRHPHLTYRQVLPLIFPARPSLLAPTFLSTKVIAKQLSITYLFSLLDARSRSLSCEYYFLIPEYQTRKFQRVMNTSARLIYRARKFCHITPLLAEFHWLPVRSRIHYKILFITFKILHSL